MRQHPQCFGLNQVSMLPLLHSSITPLLRSSRQLRLGSPIYSLEQTLLRNTSQTLRERCSLEIQRQESRSHIKTLIILLILPSQILRTWQEHSMSQVEVQVLPLSRQTLCFIQTPQEPHSRTPQHLHSI